MRRGLTTARHGPPSPPFANRLDIRTPPGFFPDFASLDHETGMGALDRLLRKAAVGAAGKQDAALAGERVRRAAALAGAPQVAQPTSFVTERAGSLYQVSPDGTTTRTKAASPNHPMHQDAGAKSQSSSTYYLPAEAAVVAQAAYASGRSPLSGKPLTRLVVEDGRPVLMRMTFERESTPAARGLPGRPIRELGYVATPLELAPGPAVGLSPLEFFEDGGFHLGSRITELR